jgi:hypothetical protein
MLCRMETKLYRITGDSSYTGLTNLILTLKSNRLSILYQLHQNRLMLKELVIGACSTESNSVIPIVNKRSAYSPSR